MLLKRAAKIYYPKRKTYLLMVDFEITFSRSIKVVSYTILCSLIFISFYYLNWNVNNYIILLILILCGYTIVFSLPITRIKMGLSGFEAELNRLVEEKPEITDTIEAEKEEAEKEYEDTVRDVEPDILVMKLSVDIETTMRRIAKASGITRLNVSMGQLTRELRRMQILTDTWLLSSLDFFRIHRNEVIHEGRKQDLEKAIDIGFIIIAQLRDIENKNI